MENLTIGITTKGRVEELRKTLEIIQDHEELASSEIILINDGGGEPFISEDDYDLKIRILSFERSEGLVARRNLLARESSGDYLLSLDDDSAPIWGSFIKVLEIFNKDKKVATVALRLVGNSEDFDSGGQQYLSRYFIGCGHIHRLNVYNKLGGYLPELLYGHEEIAYSYLLYSNNFKVVHTDEVIIRHRRSRINRQDVTYNWRIHYNMGYVHGCYLGTWAKFLEFVSFVKLRLRCDKDFLRSIKDYWKGRWAAKKFDKMEWSCYRYWKKLRVPSIR